MPDNNDKEKPDPENWTGRTAARRFTVWMIIWVLIGFAIITRIIAF